MKFRGFLHVLLAAACLLAPVGAAAQNVKISAMPAASALDGTELYAGVQGIANVKITGNQIKTFLGGQYGANTQVLFNDSGVVAGSAGLTYNKATSALSVGSLAATTSITFGAGSFLSGGGIGLGYANSGEFIAPSAGAYTFGSSGLNSPDLFLRRDAAGTLAQRNGVNAQQFNFYNTFTDTSNYERGTLGFIDTANTLVLATRALGTGTGRSITLSSAASMFFQANGSAGPFWTLNTTGFWSPSTDNAYDIGLAAGNQPRSIYAKTNIQSPIFTSTVSTGTAPFTVASTTVVANLNASQLGGATFSAPGAIGGGTPGSGAFTSLTASTTANITGILTTQSGQVVKLRVVTASGAVTVATTDYVVVVNKTVGAATAVNLPGSPVTGQIFIIKDGKGDATANNITLTPAAGNIDGAATKVMNINYQSMSVVYNGTEWSIF